MQRTLKRESKVLEIVKRETIVTGSPWPPDTQSVGEKRLPSFGSRQTPFQTQSGRGGAGPQSPLLFFSVRPRSGRAPPPWAHLSVVGRTSIGSGNAGEGLTGGRWRALHGVRVTASGRATPLPEDRGSLSRHSTAHAPDGVGTHPPVPQPGGDRAAKKTPLVPVRAQVAPLR